MSERAEGVLAAGGGGKHADLNRASLLQDRATACQPGRFFEVRGADEAGGSNFCNKQAGRAGWPWREDSDGKTRGREDHDRSRMALTRAGIISCRSPMTA